MDEYALESYFGDVADVQDLKDLAKIYREIRENGDDLGIDWFFQTAFTPYWDPCAQGMTTDRGHFLYRLSEFLPAEERQKISLYPDDHGSLIDGALRSASLEDWRTYWERKHPDIPTFQRELSDILLLE